MAIEEKNGRWTCSDCGYEWSGMCGDNEIPEYCECQIIDGDEVISKIHETLEEVDFDGFVLIHNSICSRQIKVISYADGRFAYTGERT